MRIMFLLRVDEMDVNINAIDGAQGQREVSAEGGRAGIAAH